MFLSNGSRTTSLRKLNLYVFTFTFLDCLSGGSLTTSLTTGWAERFSPEARCPLTHSFSISRSVCECELRKWKWFSSMTKCVWNLYHIHIMDGSESINCAGRSQNRAFMGGFRRAVCKVNKVKLHHKSKDVFSGPLIAGWNVWIAMKPNWSQFYRPHTARSGRAGNNHQLHTRQYLLFIHGCFGIFDT